MVESQERYYMSNKQKIKLQFPTSVMIPHKFYALIHVRQTFILTWFISDNQACLMGMSTSTDEGAL